MDFCSVVLSAITESFIFPLLVSCHPGKPQSSGRVESLPEDSKRGCSSSSDESRIRKTRWPHPDTPVSAAPLHPALRRQRPQIRHQWRWFDHEANGNHLPQRRHQEGKARLRCLVDDCSGKTNILSIEMTAVFFPHSVRTRIIDNHCQLSVLLITCCRSTMQRKWMHLKYWCFYIKKGVINKWSSVITLKSFFYIQF